MSSHCNFCQLGQSGMATWENDKILKGTIGYSTLMKRMRRGKLGIVKGQVWSDCCVICSTWDAVVQNKIAHAFQVVYCI